MRSFTRVAVASGILFSSIVSALNPIVIKGNAFFDSVTGDRFYIRGVDYQVSIIGFLEEKSVDCYLAWRFLGCELRSFSVGMVI